jgi:sulfatase modifying factor 1
MDVSLKEENSFIEAMLATPDDEFLRLVFANWLEEWNPRSELLRVTHTLTQSLDLPNRPQLEARMRVLLKEGVQPIGPFWTNSLGMRFAWIPSGAFFMGSPNEEEERGDGETQHKVTLSRGFFMGVHTVTQKQWRAVIGNNPSRFKGERNLPVDSVSWNDCQKFIKKLRKTDQKAYRLPSEAEWEYACRAGTTTPFHYGKTISTDQANFNGGDYIYGPRKKGKYRKKTTPVGSFPANSFGCYDMGGNVFEWCQDWYGAYPQKDVIDPQGPDKGDYRVLRGGSWGSIPRFCRSAFRHRNQPGIRGSAIGFRLCFCLQCDQSSPL